MIANLIDSEVRPGSMGRPLPGIEAAVLERDDDGNVVLDDTGAPVAVTEPDHQGELALREPRELPECIAADVRSIFQVAQVALKVWDCHGVHAREPFALGASSAARAFAGSLVQPYCGVNAGFEATAWLDDPASVMSLAMIPLRHGDAAFGLLVLGSPDPTRYGAEMGTEFLMRIGEVASAGLSRLLPASPTRGA